MKISLNRIMLFVQDVEAMSAFYEQAFGFAQTEYIAGEWAVLNAGACEIALHRVGAAWRGLEPQPQRATSPTKLVFSVSGDLTAVRDDLIARDTAVGEIKSWPGSPGPLCDGRDPEGNVFQLVQVEGCEEQPS